MKSAFILVSFVATVCQASGFDIQFLHNESSSGYTIIINDDYGKEVKIPLSEKEMLMLTENPKVIDSRTGKERRYLEMFVENVRKQASTALF